MPLSLIYLPFFVLPQNLVSYHTEVQRVSFVGYTGGEGGSLRLWNLQNLHAVPS